MSRGNEIKEDSIRTRYQATRDEIEAACKASSRSIDEIKLVVVTKGHDSQKISEAINAGANFIGENYPQETVDKLNLLSTREKQAVEWVMIGHLQSRKIDIVVNNFAWFHALDSIRLAEKMNIRLLQQNKKFRVLLQCNVSGEKEKFGIPAWEEKNWSTLLPIIEQLIRLDKLDLKGLMTMPPFTEVAEQNRVYFDRLRRLRDYLGSHFTELALNELSMGTSQDFTVAIQEGATFLRIGTKIMGQRS